MSISGDLGERGGWVKGYILVKTVVYQNNIFLVNI